MNSSGFIPACESLLGGFTVSCFLYLCLCHLFFWFCHSEMNSSWEKPSHTLFRSYLTVPPWLLATHPGGYCLPPSSLFLYSFLCTHAQTHKWLYVTVCLLSLHSVGVYSGDCSSAGAQHSSVCLGDPPLWLLHLCKPPRCAGHLEVQVLLQGPRAGVLLHR